MRAHYLQHVPFETLAAIDPWLRHAGYTITHTPLYEPADLPDPRDLDLLIVLGGPMSANDEPAFPWLADEKRFLRAAIDAHVPTLGVCLGAQLIAAALGAQVYPNRTKEIGWFPVYSVRTDASDNSLFRFPDALDVFHWHSETFDLPPGCVPLARSAATDLQAFQLQRHVLALQFHLETTPDSAAQLAAHGSHELTPDTWVQPADTLLAAPPQTYLAIHALLDHALKFLTQAP